MGDDMIDQESEDDDFRPDNGPTHDFWKEQVRIKASYGNLISRMLLSLEASASQFYIPDDDDDLPDEEF